MGERRDGVHAAFAGFILVFIYVTREAPEGLGVVFLFWCSFLESRLADRFSSIADGHG